MKRLRALAKNKFVKALLSIPVFLLLFMREIWYRLWDSWDSTHGITLFWTSILRGFENAFVGFWKLIKLFKSRREKEEEKR